MERTPRDRDAPLGEGAEVNAQGGHFGNALQAASLHGNQEVVELLLEKGAEINAQGGYFGNALQAASSSGNQGIVELLLNNGADVHAQGGKHGNALQAAFWKGDETIARLLGENGAVLSGGEVETTVIKPKQEVVSQSPKPVISLDLTSLWWGIFFALASWLLLRFLATDE
ncbi:ankyrin repeat and SOCS box protein 8 [Colletotrichum liriopes]|uniref:Ankyrin repeat and SOCS box protein 8 n=1 Tax=Colletotrichum liriopes TaxID=708192 RepID=A0AA37GZZ3_9PEZI|nr:ankyrin repeat and SOCS box protein 8 [Colletotrichum liriopes]